MMQSRATVCARTRLPACNTHPVPRSRIMTSAKGTSSTAAIVVKPADEAFLESKGVKSWPTWGHGVDKFPWTYDSNEDAYLLKGKVVVTPTGGSPVTIKAGDFVTFPSGMSCTWEILEPVYKHYDLY